MLLAPPIDEGHEIRLGGPIRRLGPGCDERLEHRLPLQLSPPDELLGHKINIRARIEESSYSIHMGILEGDVLVLEQRVLFIRLP